MLFQPLFAHAAARPNDIAVIDDIGQHTFASVAAMSVGLGMYLSAQTDRKAVGILLPAGVGFLAGFYATLLAGKTAVPINFLLGDREIAHVLADSGIDTIISAPPLAARLAGSNLKVIDLTQLPSMPAGAVAPTFPSPQPDDIATLLYTSGTAGLPKGVCLSYRNLQSDVDACISHARLRGDHKFLGIIPLFHSTGLLATMLAPVQLGAQIVYIARFSPVATVNAIREHRISIMAAVPSMYGAMIRLKEPTPADMASLWAPLSGGEPLPTAIREGFEKRFGVKLMEGYGLTETCGPICFNAPHQHKAGSVGTLIPGATVRITDDNANPLPPGVTGEIWFKGPMVFREYHKLPAETAAAKTADGYFRTGDLGHIDDDGFLHVTGRIKDLIIISGEKVYPREVEETISRHPAVADCAVVGRKDEAVVAFVIPREGVEITPDQVRTFCRESGLVNWKCPRDVIITRELPRSPTGKVLKRVLVEQLAASN